MGRGNWRRARDGSPRWLYFLWPGRTGHPQKGTFLKFEELVGKCLLTVFLPDPGPQTAPPPPAMWEAGLWEGLTELPPGAGEPREEWSSVPKLCIELLECSHCLEKVEGVNICSVSAPFLLPFHLPALNFLHSVLGQCQSFLESLRHLACARSPSSDFQEKCSFRFLKLGVILCLRIS